MVFSITLNSLHIQSLTLTDVQTPFHGTPLVPLKLPAGPSAGAEEFQLVVDGDWSQRMYPRTSAASASRASRRPGSQADVDGAPLRMSLIKGCDVLPVEVRCYILFWMSRTKHLI